MYLKKQSICFLDTCLKKTSSAVCMEMTRSSTRGPKPTHGSVHTTMEIVIDQLYLGPVAIRLFLPSNALLERQTQLLLLPGVLSIEMFSWCCVSRIVLGDGWEYLLGTHLLKHIPPAHPRVENSHFVDESKKKAQNTKLRKFTGFF